MPPFLGAVGLNAHVFGLTIVSSLFPHEGLALVLTCMCVLM